MGMKKIILTPTLLLLASTFGCDGEADIGVGSEPVTCTAAAGTAEVQGSVVDPDTGTRYDFGAASATAIAYDTGAAMLSLGDQTLSLRFGFYCQTHAPGSYKLVADAQQGLHCPIEVAGAVFGAIEY